MSTHRRAFAGTAMAEFVIVALPLLFLGFGILEASRWYVARQAVSYALFEAARAGTVLGARRDAIRQALERGLVPLLGDGATGLAQGQDNVRRRLEQRTGAWGMPPLQLEILSPARADFDDFSDATLRSPIGGGRRVIGNDYQQERHARDYSSRYRNGIGPRSGQTLFGANTLVIKVSYLHEPMLPGLRALIRTWANASKPDEGYVGQAHRKGLIAIVRDISMPMQSHGIEND